MASGSNITYNDLSTLRNTMNTILNGTGVHGGYNQGHTVAANPSTGDLIDDAYHDSLYSAAAKISNYYNISNPFTAVNAGTTVDWDHYGASASTFNSDINTRFDNPWSYSSGWDTSVTTETSSTKSNWNGAISTEITVTFTNEATKNAWFAAGGEIRVSMSHSDTSNTNQGDSWEQLTAEVGTFRYSVRPQDTTNVDTRTRYKYSDLTSSFVVHKREYANASDYSGNYIEISALETSTTVKIKVYLSDVHTADSGSWSNDGGGSWTGTDVATGTTTVETASLKMTNASGSVSISQPTFSVTESL